MWLVEAPSPALIFQHCNVTQIKHQVTRLYIKPRSCTIFMLIKALQTAHNITQKHYISRVTSKSLLLSSFGKEMNARKSEHEIPQLHFSIYSHINILIILPISYSQPNKASKNIRTNPLMTQIKVQDKSI